MQKTLITCNIEDATLNLWISTRAFCSLSIITASSSLSAKQRRFRIRSVMKNREDEEEGEEEEEENGDCKLKEEGGIERRKVESPIWLRSSTIEGRDGKEEEAEKRRR